MIFTLPADIPETTPELLTVAMAVFEEYQTKVEAGVVVLERTLFVVPSQIIIPPVI